jgi:oxygen-independent coproporphyrinogen-3 oxidase
MALYIHIPFCKQACSYCNFHFSTSLGQKDAMLSALHDELRLRKDYLKGAALKSIYLGGGTPSILTSEELTKLFNVIEEHYRVEADAEITLEANPDDLTSEKIVELRDTPINRLSIGVQSFYDDELQYMNRAHNAKEAVASLEQVSRAGFKSWTADLIYGTPLMTDERWSENLARITSLGAPHLSAYQLTIENGTAIAHQIRQGLSSSPDDAATAAQFEALMDWADSSGYEHYEISNLAKPGHRAVHNSSYWQRTPYLGVGPSAHSFRDISREWNIANNALYIKSIATGSAQEGSETLTPDERFNEFIMTGLRTIEGISREGLLSFGDSYYAHFTAGVVEFIDTHQMQEVSGRWMLTKSGKMFADRIAAELFMV